MYKGTQAELVKELGCSRTAISKLVRAKDYRIIYINGGPRINIEKTLNALISSGFGKRSKPLKPRSNKPKTEPPTKEEIEEDLESEGPLKLTDTRERIERHKAFHQAEKERINNEKSIQELINLNEITERSFNLWRQVRDSIQSVKDRCAIKVRASESDHEAEQILNEEAYRILSSIVDGYENLDDGDIKKKLVLRLIK